MSNTINKENTLNFQNIILSLIDGVKSHVFYAYLIQSLLIFYAYIRGVGKNGKFWRIIYIGTFASFLGAVITKLCEIIGGEDPRNASNIIYFILIAHETLYAMRNLVLPYVNMIKVMPLLEEKEIKKLRIFISVMTILHFAQRYYIGYLRFQKKNISGLDDKDIMRQYGFSLMTVSITDTVYSMIIIKKLVENYNIAVKKKLKISVYKYFFQSALFILIFVDFFSLIVGILYIVDTPIIKIISIPLYGFNSNVILLLAFDALIFKNGVMVKVDNHENLSSGSGYFSDSFSEDRIENNYSSGCTDQCISHSHHSDYYHYGCQSVASFYPSQQQGSSPSNNYYSQSTDRKSVV